MAAGASLSVLHVAAPATVGGLERVVHGLAIGHHRRGHRVRVAALIGPGETGAAFIEPLEAAGVEVARAEVSLRSVRSERAFIRGLCRAERPHAVHTHGYRPDIVDGGVARGLGIPSCSTEHGFSRMGGRTAVYEWLQLRCLRRFEAVAAVSTPIAETLARVGVPRDRIHRIPNAWPDSVEFLDRDEARRALEVAADERVVGWVGRLIPAKGADVFLEALVALADLPFRVVLIGDGPERAALAEHARRLGLAERVRFHGGVSHAAPLFRAFDLFALTSRTEGSPIVLFEAMAAGVPVVATRVGGVPEALPEDAAWLVPSEDPRELARGLRAALEDPAAAGARAERARRRLAEAYGVEPWLDAYEDFYRAALRARS